MAVTSRSIVRTGIAQFFGGTQYVTEARAYRGNGPLASFGLSTVRAYQPKRMSDMDYVIGQAAGRGMGAAMVLQMADTRDHLLTGPQLPAGTGGGHRMLVYPVNAHVYHMAHMAYAEDAEADVDALDQALHEHIYSDFTLGGICYQAGMNSAGIRTVINESEVYKEITVTHFCVSFDAELQITV